MQIAIPMTSESAASPADYTWYEFTSPASISILYRGKAVQLISGTRFGLREASKGSITRIVMENDINKVMSLTPSERAVIDERSQPAKTSKAKTSGSRAYGVKKFSDKTAFYSDVLLWNSRGAKLLRSAMANIKANDFPTLEAVKYMRNISNALKPITEADNADTATITKALDKLEKLVSVTIPKAKPKAGNLAGGDVEGMRIFKNAISNKYLINIPAKISSSDDILGAFVQTEDLANHIELAHAIYTGNKAKAKKLSFLDTASRDLVPNKSWDWIQDNLR